MGRIFKIASIVYIGLIGEIFGQTPNADFSFVDNVCLGESINFANNSSNSSDYFWNFCPYIFESTLNSELYTSITNGGRNLGIDFIESSGIWYGLVTSWDKDKLYKITFGNGLNEIPTMVEDLGNPTNVLNDPVSINLITQNNEVYALVQNWGTQNLVKIHFTNGISSSEVTGSVVVNAFGKVLSKMDVINTKTELKAILINQDATIEIVDFSNDINQVITASNILKTSAISGVTNTRAITMIQDVGSWYAFIPSFSTGEVIRVDFGTDIMSGIKNVQQDVTTNLYEGGSPNNIQIFNSASSYELHISTFQGNTYKVKLGQNITNNGLASGSVKYRSSGFSQGYAFKYFFNEGKLNGFVLDDLNTKVYRISSGEPCLSNLDYSDAFEPQMISFSRAGTYPISLQAFDINENVDFVTKYITITSNTAPDINLSSQNICQSNPINFTSVNNSSNISSYLWSFGDNTTSTTANPSHAYASPGDYLVNLSVTSTDGCNNFIEKTITIYPEPIPSFSLPSGLVCTNDNYTFENTTPGDFGGNITWEWQVDGVAVSTDLDLKYNFATSGSHEVKLIAAIPGCSSEVSQTISNIQEGPTADFSVNDDCVGQLLQFTNNSSGDITSFQWDFGNGFTSNVKDPQFEYPDAGTFDVTLTLQNAAGCESNITKTVNVFDLPDVQFVNDLACEGSPTQFTDETQISDANLKSWLWDFGDGTISAERNPAHTFENAGDYNVKLRVSSTNGCMDSTTLVVTIKPAPDVDFSYDKLCIDEAIQFQDQTTPVPGENLVSWAWDLGGVFSAEQNPVHSFEFPISYNVGLTVGSENLCASTVYKIIKINPAPEVKFIVDDACSNVASHFYDQTSPEGDKIISRQWNFSSLGVASDSSVYHQFSTPDVYDVSLSVNTENGCFYNGTQQVEIYTPPKADFRASVSFGASPLKVDFFNQSERATDYRWDFKDGKTSMEKDPSHIFTDEDIYNVQLIASDINLCRDTTDQIISVLIPDLEVELSNAFLQGQSIILTLKNNGTLVIDSLLVNIDLGDQIILNETIVATILPGEQINTTLNFEISSIKLKYICLYVEGIKTGITDSKPDNNSKCLNLSASGATIILPPQPNPASSGIFVNIVLKNSQGVDLSFYDARGKLVKRNRLREAKIGLNKVFMDVSDLEPAMYILRVISGNQTSSFRLMISR